MTTPLWCLVVVVFLPYVLAFTGSYFKLRQLGKVDNKNPRAQAAQLEGVGARAVAAQANAWEAVAVFTVAVAVLHLANPEAARSQTAANLALGFVAARIVHAAAYLANIDMLRSGVFLVAIVCAVWLIALA